MTLAISCESGSLNPMSFTDQHGALLLERMRYQRETGRFCDVVIRVHERSFAAHRNVLAACSPYFDSILKTNLVTKEQVTVNCPSASAFELLLNYMYSGSVVIDRSTVAELLKLANNFLITKVKNYCAEYLDRNLDAANCLSVRQLASKYNLPLLYKAASDFFDVNINRCLLESVDLLQFSATQILKIIEDPKYHNMISADALLKMATRWASEDIGGRAADFTRLLAACQLVQLSQAAVSFVLDYSPLMNKHQPARLALLQALSDAGVSLPRYNEQYEQLLEQFGQDPQLMEQPQQQYDGHCSEMADDLSASEGEEDEMSVEGQPSASQVLAARNTAVLAMSSADEQIQSASGGGGGIKLRIQIGGGQQKMSKEEKEKKRQARHLKKRRRSRGSDAQGGRSPSGEDAEGAQFDEDEIDGVFGNGLEDAVLFLEADAVDPSTVNEMEEEENEPGGQFICIHCRFATNDNEDFHKHMARRHNGRTVFVCCLCPPSSGGENTQFESGWNSAFYEHVAAAHLPGAPPFQCDLCDFSTPGPIHEFLNHRLMAHCPSERPFKCAVCSWSARSRSQLWAHERIHAGSANFSCIECGRAFRKAESLAKHTETHGEQRVHVCADCGWASRTEADLLAHRALSHQVDVYNCHITGCDYVSAKKSQLAAHLRTHLAVRAHLCKICGRGFIEKSHVVRHERIHLEEKPFKCEQCEYASSRRDKLKEHILKHHSAGGEGGTAHVQKRRYKRTKHLAAAIAANSQQMKQQQQSIVQPAESLFRPIDPQTALVSRERFDLWPPQVVVGGGGGGGGLSLSPLAGPPRAFSVAPLGGFAGLGGSTRRQSSPGSMSLMNVQLRRGPDTPLLGDDEHNKPEQLLLGRETPPLVTPVPRSPHNHSDPFMLNAADDPHRPMSLPPYGGGTPNTSNWF